MEGVEDMVKLLSSDDLERVELTVAGVGGITVVTGDDSERVELTVAGVGGITVVTGIRPTEVEGEGLRFL